MAKKFKFKLESVLRFRAEKVNQAQEALNNVVRLRIEKENLILDRISTRKEALKKSFSKVKAGDLQNNSSFITSLDNEIVKLENEKQQIIEIENVRRKKLTDAMKDEKIIEKLKEKQLSEYTENLKREEAIFLDEIGIKSAEKRKRES